VAITNESRGPEGDDQPVRALVRLDDPDELRRYLYAYRPAAVVESDWLAIQADAVDLVWRAGELTRARLEKDIQCVGGVVAMLAERGQPLTLDEVVADNTQLNYDVVLQRRGAGARTHENKRGILRRLQAVHHGLPWARPGVAEGQRIETDEERVAISMVAARDLQDLLASTDGPAAANAGSDEEVVLRIVSEALETPRAITTFDGGEWKRVHAFARSHGVRLTKDVLRQAVIATVLERAVPLTVLIDRHQLTAGDVDLVAKRSSHASADFDSGEQTLLRGDGDAR
jgi:hypothetical protein